MSFYRVYAVASGVLELLVEADSEEEAYELALVEVQDEPVVWEVEYARLLDESPAKEV